MSVKPLPEPVLDKIYHIRGITRLGCVLVTVKLATSAPVMTDGDRLRVKSGEELVALRVTE